MHPKPYVLALGVESIADAGDGLFQEHLPTCDKGYHLLVEAVVAESIVFVGQATLLRECNWYRIIGIPLDYRL